MKEMPVDLLDVVGKIQQISHERPGKISYRVIDPQVHLYIRVDANGQADFAYRRKKPTIVRLLGRVFDLELKTAIAMCLEMEAKVCVKRKFRRGRRRPQRAWLNLPLRGLSRL